MLIKEFFKNKEVQKQICRISRNCGGGTSGGITGLLEAGTNVIITGSGTSDSPYVINSLGGGGGDGDMYKIMYDPNNIEADVFNRSNHTGTQSISTITGLQTALDSKANASTALEDITGLILEGTGISITGAGTPVSPYTINTSGVGAIWGLLTGDIEDQDDLMDLLDTKVTGSASDFATSAQGETADSALQSIIAATPNVTIDTTDPTNPTISVSQSSVNVEWGDIDGDIEDQEDLNLALGAKANTSDLSDVALSGDYEDLINTPTLGTAAAADTDDFATAAQGEAADSALQNITSLITEGSNITITGLGTLAVPYVINSTGGGGGGGDMLQSVYDPNNIEEDVYARANHTGTQAISTVSGLQSALDGKADNTITVTGTSGLTGGGSLTVNRTISLNSASIASLLLADSAVQPGDLGLVAFSDDYEDLNNLPTIPAQFNPIEGTGISITGTYPNLTITATGGTPGTVTSVNDVTPDGSGNVEIDSDDIDEGTTNLFLSPSERSKLTGIESGAQVNTVTSVNTRTGAVTGLAEASDLTAHTSNTSNPHSVTKTQVGLSNVDNTADIDKPISNDVQDALDDKVDKVVGKQLSDENFTLAEKNKLAGLEEPHYRGIYDDEADIQNISDPQAGDYALLDEGIGESVIAYFYDPTDEEWYPGGGSSDLTPAQIKSLYESNPDTNAFTDDEKSKLSGIATGATANSSDATLLNRANHTGTQAISTITGLEDALNDKQDTLTPGTGIDIAAGVITNTAPNATHTGDVTGSTALTIADDAVTFTKMQDIPTASLIGRYGAGTGDAQSITLGGNMTLSGGGVLNSTNTTYTGSTSIILTGGAFQRAALTGDVASPQNSNSTTIANAAVTNAKMANMTGFTVKAKPTTGSGAPTDLALGTNTLLGRGSGNIVPITLGTGLSITGSTLNAAGGDNLFTANLSLAANRTHNINDNELRFLGGSGGEGTVHFGFQDGELSAPLEAFYVRTANDINFHAGDGLGILANLIEIFALDSNLSLYSADNVIIESENNVRINNLSGTGTRTVIVDTDGNLSASALPVVTTNSTASTATLTITRNSSNYYVTALSQNITIPNPTLEIGDKAVVWIKDNGTTRTITFGNQYFTFEGNDLPTATTVNKWMQIIIDKVAADTHFITSLIQS